MGAAGDVDDRVAVVLLDLGPRALLGVDVLSVDRDVGLVAVHPQLHHLPVALVQASVERERVVVVEVPEPVLEPDAAVLFDRMTVGAVPQLGPGDAQRHVLGAVVAAGIGDEVGGLDRAAVGVLRLAEHAERERGRAGQQRAVAAAQLVAGVVGPLRRAVGEVLLVRVVAQARQELPQQLVVLAHTPPIPAAG
jgi:hypothetical protein